MYYFMERCGLTRGILSTSKHNRSCFLLCLKEKESGAAFHWHQGRLLETVANTSQKNVERRTESLVSGRQKQYKLAIKTATRKLKLES